MGRIFRTAKRVIVWLGEPRRLVPKLDQAPSKPAYSRLKRSPECLSSALESALAIKQPPWWQRAWTVQEYTLAYERPMFVCGPCNFSIESLADLLQVRVTGDLASLQKAVTRLEGLRNQAERLRELDTYDVFCLVELHDIMCNVSSTDPRDKVYGMLGLMKKSLAEAIKVDYIAGTERVYAQAMYAQISSDRTLRVLCFARPWRTKQDRASWHMQINGVSPRPIDTRPFLVHVIGDSAPIHAVSPFATQHWEMSPCMRFLTIIGRFVLKVCRSLQFTWAEGYESFQASPKHKSENASGLLREEIYNAFMATSETPLHLDKPVWKYLMAWNAEFTEDNPTDFAARVSSWLKYISQFLGFAHVQGLDVEPAKAPVLHKPKSCTGSPAMTLCYDGKPICRRRTHFPAFPPDRTSNFPCVE
ncbi:hypothetical protein LTR78_006226 [Recurvomyces mirabilis]|uniref:Heterokaryon incompatibility domain-containing protein n=1 Tax=Recurvomyces mirabilis TaxID=574656 RepID=A0AAE0WLP4_9PEZI|nr:hypothetical protein LTR78_006226 [Recurvomyces mirabilis]KAK5152067.1 hypothetical protein LTS14_008842 [Recurvomyces mirabilis]